MLRVGLTGGIASGKTRVLTRLAERGLAALDLDRVAHTVVEPGRPAHVEILRLFGPSVAAADGRIDRRVLGGIVFSDAAAREDLNAIVHPRVFEEEQRLAAELAAAGNDVVVTDATLLVESGYHVRYGRLIATCCRVEQQLERLIDRDGLAEADARARIAAQMPMGEKARYAHRVIDTSGSEEETDRAAVALAGELRSLGTSWGGPAPVALPRAVGCLVRGPQEGPRGLTPLRLAQAIVEHGAPPYALLARRLVPPAPGPWYAAGSSTSGGPGPETLMGPIVLWCRAWHGADVECLLASAVSTARLTHSQPVDLARAAAFALALHLVLDAGGPTADLGVRLYAEASRVERWTGVPAAPAFMARLGSPPPSPAPGSLEGALIGLARGVPAGEAAAETVAIADALQRGPAGPSADRTQHGV